MVANSPIPGVGGEHTVKHRPCNSQGHLGIDGACTRIWITNAGNILSINLDVQVAVSVYGVSFNMGQRFGSTRLMESVLPFSQEKNVFKKPSLLHKFCDEEGCCVEDARKHT